eukprot:scaffold421210_cov50-Attheya_sp.AAC.4
MSEFDVADKIQNVTGRGSRSLCDSDSGSRTGSHTVEYLSQVLGFAVQHPSVKMHLCGRSGLYR